MTNKLATFLTIKIKKLPFLSPILFMLLSGGCKHETLDEIVNKHAVKKTQQFIQANMYTRNQYTVIPSSNNTNPLVGPNGSTSLYKLQTIDGAIMGTFDYNGKTYSYAIAPRHASYTITVKGSYISNSFSFSLGIPPNLPPLPAEIQNNMKNIQ